MRISKSVLILLSIFLTFFMSCEKEETELVDNLEEVGILGKWRLLFITVNGITDMSIRFDTIEFCTDSERGDLKGKFSAIGTGYETNGVFEIEKKKEIIYFDYNNTQKIYGFQISYDLMTFSYTKDGQDITEDWSRLE